MPEEKQRGWLERHQWLMIALIGMVSGMTITTKNCRFELSKSETPEVEVGVKSYSVEQDSTVLKDLR